MIIIMYVCFESLKSGVRGEQPLIELYDVCSKRRIPVIYWENSIGRSRNCDIVLEGMTVSRDHAVLFRRDKGWIISDTNSKMGVFVNGIKVEGSRQVLIDDVINIGGIDLIVKKSKSKSFSKNEIYNQDTPLSRQPSASGPLFLVTVFHFLASFTACIHFDIFNIEPAIAFGIVTIISWLTFFITKHGFRRVNFELETLAMLLSGIGIITISAVDIKAAYTQMLAMAFGIGLFFIILFFIKNPDRAMKFRPYVAAAALLLFVMFGCKSLFINYLI